jgi:hypothetical protein
MWLMPSYGRPDAPGKLLEAPGGMPSDVAVLVNADDPCFDQYVERQLSHWSLWRLIVVPSGSRFADAVRHAFEQYPDRNYYGIIDDDYWPITPGWYDKMIDAAGGTGIAIANNRENFPRLWGCRLMGGALARAIGTIAPGKMRHNFSDDTWARFADDFKVLHALEDVIVEHHHHSFGKAEVDDTYRRGSGDYHTDERLFHEWLESQERRDQVDRVAALLGYKVKRKDLSKVHLAICTPMQTMQVDMAYFVSYTNMMLDLMKCGVKFTTFPTFGGSHIGKARERTLWRAMADKRITHLLFIDDDMGWDAHLPVRLIMSDHEFCAAVGVRKQENIATEDKYCFNPLPGRARFHETTKFLDVRDVGFAFVLLERGVVDKMCAAYPGLRYNTKGEPEYALFFDMIDKSDTEKGEFGERLSEDFAFCRRWRAIGGEIWVDPRASLTHAGRKEYVGSPDETFKYTKELDSAA